MRCKKSYYLAHSVLLLDNTRAAFENEPFFKVLWLAAPHKQQGNSNWVKVTRSQKLKLPPDEISYLISSTTGLVQHSWDDHRFSMTSQRSNRRKKAFRAISPFVSWWLFAHMLSSLFETSFNMSASFELQVYDKIWKRCLWRKPLFLLFISYVFIISSVRRKSFSFITFTQESDYRSYQPEHEPKTLCSQSEVSLF